MCYRHASPQIFYCLFTQYWALSYLLTLVKWQFAVEIIESKFYKQANSLSRYSDKCRGKLTCLQIEWKSTKHAVCGILHYRSFFPYHPAIIYNQVQAVTDNVGQLYIFTILCLHLTFTLPVSFSLNHLHHSQTHFHDKINGGFFLFFLAYRIDCIFLFSSEWNHDFFHFFIDMMFTRLDTIYLEI